MTYDPYWEAVQELMPNILAIYEEYSDKQPIMLLDIQEQRLYVYPYREFKDDLSQKSQLSLQKQYEKAIAEDRMVVFVRDNDQKKLVSYTV